MPQSTDRLSLPPLRLVNALRMRCPHCGKTPLLKSGAWFTFRDGCQTCGYRFEREEGYFTGAAWVLTYTAGGLVGLVSGALMLWRYPEVDSLVLALVAAGLAGLTAILFMPLGKALWIYLDHFLHPLEQQEGTP